MDGFGKEQPLSCGIDTAFLGSQEKHNLPLPMPIEFPSSAFVLFITHLVHAAFVEPEHYTLFTSV